MGTRPDDPRFPQVCLAEVSKQLLRDTCGPLPVPLGQAARTDQRTTAAFAEQIRTVGDLHSPDAERIVRVMDHRTTHTPEVAAWEERRNAAARSIDWRFTAEDARIKLKRLYP